jgi:hypothetical protein
VGSNENYVRSIQAVARLSGYFGWKAYISVPSSLAGVRSVGLAVSD